MRHLENYAVIGAGNGGKAMAAHLALMGYRVALYNRTFGNIAAIKAGGGIELKSYSNGPQGFSKLALTTSNMGEALKDAEMIMVVVPSTAHADIAKKVAPHLQDGQVIILHPGRTLGALEFAKVLRDNQCEANVTLAEAETLLYVSRSDGPTSARIFTIKETVPLAAFPATRTASVLKAVRPAFPQFVDGVNVLQTGLNNMGAVFHPALTLLNAGWIEATHGDYEFYVDGLTPSVARVIEALDEERMAVASSLGVRARTALDWLHMTYNSTSEDLRDAMRNVPGYRGINAPATLAHRYIFDDIPMGLVPIASLGRHYGVSVPGMESIIRLGSIVHHTDYWQVGRSVEKLGLANLNAGDLALYVNEGIMK
jgi:opine dehydrogenase